MRIKKFLLILTLCVLAALAACSNNAPPSKSLNKEGIAPYILTEDEEYILQEFGIKNNSHIISFRAPKEAISLNVNVYRLDGEGNWITIGGGEIITGTETKLVETLTGNFTMQLKENYAIAFNINTNGKTSFKTDEITPEIEHTMSSNSFLQEFQEIELNKEIPVALMIYDSGTSMRSYTLQDYFTPSRFDGMDLVQAVTLTFGDKYE